VAGTEDVVSGTGATGAGASVVAGTSVVAGAGSGVELVTTGTRVVTTVGAAGAAGATTTELEVDSTCSICGVELGVETAGAEIVGVL
jgi:hypothetical protein